MKSKILLLALFVVLSAGCFDSISDSPKYDSIPFNDLANKIISQNQIFQMDDFTRYYKRINDIRIRLTKETEKDDSSTVYLDKVIDSLHLNRKIINQLRDELQKTELREFYKRNDSILFKVDGFLDTEWGFFYTAKNITNDSAYFSFGSPLYLCSLYLQCQQSLEKSRNQQLNSVNYIFSYKRGCPTEDHTKTRGTTQTPFFGKMTLDEWGLLNYKHFDHHLRQFGV